MFRALIRLWRVSTSFDPARPSRLYEVDWNSGAIIVRTEEARRLHEASLGDQRAQFLSALRDSVQAHLISDVPLGLFLSGGLDSASILGLHARGDSWVDQNIFPRV